MNQRTLNILCGIIIAGLCVMYSYRSGKNKYQEGVEYNETATDYANENQQLNYSPTVRPSYSSDDKSCGWCGKTFSGSHYSHVLHECYSTNDKGSIGKYCSLKCCHESQVR